MPLSEILFLAIVLYLLYRFVFNFLLPVVKTTRQVREQFKNMQEGNGHNAGGGYNTGGNYNTGSNYNAGPQQPGQQQQQKPKQPPAGEYIDFEEVK